MNILPEIKDFSLHFDYSNELRKDIKFKSKIKFSKGVEQNTAVFLSIKKPIDLCLLLNQSFTSIESIINNPEYKHYQLQKRNGGKRDILVPGYFLKMIQKTLNFYLQGYYLLLKPENSTGFVIQPKQLKLESNIVQNANFHIGKKNILNIDLKDFFTSITAARVLELFQSKHFHFDPNTAVALSLLTTYKGILPTGAPTSPVISNFICLNLDKDILDFCNSKNLTYSRYADDLTFSSQEFIDAEIKDQLIDIIKNHSFEVNKRKVHFKSSQSKQVVTGLIVNEKVNVDRAFIRKIRAMLHDWEKNGLYTACSKHFNSSTNFMIYSNKFKNKLLGYIQFLGQVRGKEDSIYLRYLNQFNALDNKY
jgi:RNA-directed DNA polymerase